MNHKVRAQVVITKAKFVMTTKRDWKTWEIEIDPKRYTTTGGRSLMRRITLSVPPEMEYVPIVGDQVELTQSGYSFWIPQTTPFTGGSPGDYERDVSTKEEFEVDGEIEMLYRHPNYSKLKYFEIKPVMCYYNPITGYQVCEVVTTNKIKLDDNPDQLIWSIFERAEGLYNCIGDWESAHAAMRVFDALNAILKVSNKISK